MEKDQLLKVIDEELRSALPDIVEEKFGKLLQDAGLRKLMQDAIPAISEDELNALLERRIDEFFREAIRKGLRKT